uniref:Uncharacterized protein n=1 Tax=Nelumbo nucifera TaxID=4432 RepID=A0A822ZIJ2_NELNU|nr:TPA_asm: hypothetical protein HUJ06_004164 [Nelumbo nucifera]
MSPRHPCASSSDPILLLSHPVKSDVPSIWDLFIFGSCIASLSLPINGIFLMNNIRLVGRTILIPGSPKTLQIFI